MSQSAWVIDSSVAVKWLVTEEGTDQALPLLDANRLIVPDLFYSECVNVLWKKQQRGELRAEDTKGAVQTLQHLVLEVVSVSTLLDEILALSIQLQHPAYDCTYLAVAKQQGVPFVTADRRLFNRCQQPDTVPLVDHIRWLGAAD